MSSPQTDLANVFWTAWADGKLLLQRCERCASVQFYPRLLCTACGAGAPAWIESTGHGSVYSFTVVRRAPTAALKVRVPYPIALIDLDEGPRLMANVDLDEATELRCDARVEAVVERPLSGWDGLLFRLR